MEPQRKQLTPEQDALEHISKGKDKPFLKKRFIDSVKGRGLFTQKAIEPSSFVVQFRGILRDNKQMKKSMMRTKNTKNDHIYPFFWNRKKWFIDASAEDGALGRLVNDDHINPNCEMKTVFWKEKPHKCLFAIRKILPGEEITYDYKKSSLSCPWRPEQPEAASDSENSDDDDSRQGQNKRTVRENKRLTEEHSSEEDTNHDDADYNPDGSAQDDSLDESDHDEDKSLGRNYSSEKNYCYFCGKAQSKVSRHLLNHAAEPEIIKLVALPKNSKERKNLLQELRNRGNVKHNDKVRKSDCGQLKLKRRHKVKLVDQLPNTECPYCKIMFFVGYLWKHVSRCSTRKYSSSATGETTRVSDEAALEESKFYDSLPMHVTKSVLKIKQVKVALAVKKDFLLLKLANSLTEKYGRDLKTQQYVTQRLREMGELLLILHDKSVPSFENAMKPANFSKVIEAVKEMARFDEKTQSYDKTDLAVKLGHSLKKIGNIVHTGVNCSKEMKQYTKTFITLCVKEWGHLSSPTATRRVANPSTIPFTQDMQIFYSFLETSSASAADSLLTDVNQQAYIALCKVTLAQASVLNKGAPAVSKMTLNTFQERGDTTRVLSKNFIRINIQSRVGSNVPVLLTSELVGMISVLVSKRQTCGVHQDNPYLFAKPNSSPTSFFNGWNCIRGYSGLCQANNPEHLRSMRLQKHIARVFQILNLENDELAHLAKLLGHEIPTDREYYRWPEAAMDLAKIAKLLLAMEKGSLEKFKGSCLQEIEVEDELEPDADQGDAEQGDDEDDNEESDPLPEQSAADEQAALEKQTRELTPEQDALEHIKTCRDKVFLEGLFIDAFKGKGVFTHESIKASSFVVEYRGKISCHKETRRNKHDSLDNYLFNFSWEGQDWCVDASKDDRSLGRLVNDDHIGPNCSMKKVVYEEKPHLCLFAIKDISPGEEITYSYGDASYPWRSTESSEKQSSSLTDQNPASPGDESVEDSAGSSSPSDSCSDDDNASGGGHNSDDSYTSNSSKWKKNQTEDPEPSVQQKDNTDYSSDELASDREPPKLPKSNINYCYVCRKACTKIARHLFTHRAQEPEIAEAYKMRPNSKERALILEKLRNRGNYKHNQKVLATSCGELKVRRKVRNVTKTPMTFAVCLYCKGMYGRKEMWRHMQRCSQRTPSDGKNRKVLNLVDAAQAIYVRENSSEVMKILREMKNDDIAAAVCNDSHILQLAQCLCHRTNCKTKKLECIRQKLRLMGRLLLILKKESINSFEETVKPENFSKLVNAVRELCGVDKDKCKKPGILMKVGELLRKIAEINLAKALREEADEQWKQGAQAFLKACLEEFASSKRAKVASPPTISFTEDVQLFSQCMESTAASAVESLMLYEFPQVFNALVRVTLTQVTILNKYVSDVCKITFKSFMERAAGQVQGEAVVPQSPFEKFMSKHFVKINVRSNTGRKLAVTMTPKMFDQITLLASKRAACGVHKDNPFLFAKPATISTSFHQGHRSLSTYLSRTKNPALLKSGFFRKHMVRMIHILSLSNEGLLDLSKLLDREIPTDSEFYQKPEAAGDIAKLSELLSAMENGFMEKFKGKSLKEIKVTDKLEPEVEENSPKSSDAEDDDEESDSEFKDGEDDSQNQASTSKAKETSKGKSARKEGEDETTETYGDEDEEKTKDKRTNKFKDKSKDGGKHRSKDKGKDKDKDKGKSKDKDKDEGKTKDKDKEKGKDKGKSKEKGREKDKDKGKNKDKEEAKNKDKTKNKEKDEEKDKDNGKNKEKDKGNDELKGKDKELNTGKDGGSEKRPLSDKSPEEKPSRSNDDTTNIYFSDDEDMNVDFDMDIDTDGDDNGETRKDGDAAVAAKSQIAGVKDASKPEAKENDDEEKDESNTIEAEDAAETDDDGGDNLMDVDERSLSPMLNTEKQIDYFAAVTGLKEVKISLNKLDIEKVRATVCVSNFLLSHSQLNDKKKTNDDKKKRQTSSANKKKDKDKDVRNKTTGEAEPVQMTCSHCEKNMAKGQTAFQMKGFTDVFCSKSCLFQMFPPNKPVTRTCHHCAKEVSQPLDLIRAAVDATGTMKDFCSTACLCNFKTNTTSVQAQTVCSKCNKSCTSVSELTVYDEVYKFCSVSCCKGFSRENMMDCEVCRTTCLSKALVLELEEEKKTFCSQKCLNSFEEKTHTSHRCTTCCASLLLSDAFHYTNKENVVRLFCNQFCLTSHKLHQLAVKAHGMRTKSTTEGMVMPSGASVNQQDAPLAADDMLMLIMAKDDVSCCHCGRKLLRSESVYKTRSSTDFFCSTTCLVEKHPTVRVYKCYNCFQVITRPHDMILAPVDDSGTNRELCSPTCLASVNSKRNSPPKPPPSPPGLRSECRTCKKLLHCKPRRALDGLMHKMCSDACYIRFHRENDLPVFSCAVCSNVCLEDRLLLRNEDGGKSICGQECLVKYKESVKSLQLCLMCQTTHHLSDMVEGQNDEGRLSFFCSNRCMMVHKAQSCTVSDHNLSERSGPPINDEDIKEVKPSMNKLDLVSVIKEEPVDEGYNPNLPPPVSTQSIKDEPNATKVSLQIGSVFSLKEDPASSAPTLTRRDLPASCSNCEKMLMDGETVYQRKSHEDIFCSTPCLLMFYQQQKKTTTTTKTTKKTETATTCHFCLQPLSQSQEVLQAPGDSEDTMEDFCSQACVSSFHYKKVVSTKIQLLRALSQSQCSMCSRYCISKREIIKQDVIYKVCSDPCFLRFCNMNNLSVCGNCHSHCNKPLVLKMEDHNQKLCNAECLSQFKQKTKAPQPCSMCSTSHLMTDMVENRNSEDVLELFCSSSCVMASEIQAAGSALNCNNCGKNSLPACHISMSDASIRNFCSLSCAMAFKETKKNMSAASNPMGSSEQTQGDISKPPEKLLCAQCRRILKTTPKVVQKKGKMYFVCSQACSQEFKMINNIMGKCEYCKTEKIIRDVRKIDNKDFYFCSDVCVVLFHNELEKTWGKHCHSCFYCLSTSRSLVTARYDENDEEFCSEECNANYNKLYCQVSKCDLCGHEGKLRQSLPLLGEVKHFCDLKCVLHFCNRKVQMGNAASSPAAPASSAESSPVIVNVISLAGALAQYKKDLAKNKQVSTPDIQKKVVGHASVQTVHKEVKNKSMLCAPLVHNKGVSCSTETVDTEAQTEKSGANVVVLPVPVYVPLPLNMYSQFTPTPVGLPLPLPVPVFLPLPPPVDGSELKGKTKKRQIQTVEDSNLQPETRRLRSDSLHESRSKSWRNHRKLRSQSGVEAWRRWIQWRESQTNLDLVSMTFNKDVLRCSVSELNDGLCRFITEVKRPDGAPYSPDGLFYLCLSIQQHLFENHRMENIFSDLTYNKFCIEFTKILKHFKPSIKTSGLTHSRVEEEFLWDCKQLGAYSPIVLLNTLLFFCCKYFGLTTVEQHRQLSFAHVMRCTKTNRDNTKSTFLRFYPPIQRPEAEPDLCFLLPPDGVPAKKRKKEEIILEMMENVRNPLHCPVRLYEFYLTKCSESVKQRSDLFYLLPDHGSGPSSQLWFTSESLDHDTLEAMLVRILAVRELQEDEQRGGNPPEEEEEESD